jgi:glucose-6-phosphate isomerase
LTVQALGLFLDYSKNRITGETLNLLIRLAEESGLRERIDAMFRGEKINVTEKRAVLHTALRVPRDASIVVDGENVVPKVHAVLDRMTDFANRLRTGEWRGHTGKRIRNLVNVGIGGSDLGPVMAYEALKYYAERTMTFRFVSNIDGTDFAEAVQDLDPSETLFIISSKTFTTLETMTNAHTARAWSLAGLGGDEKSVAKHFVAVSTNTSEVARFGIDTANMFEFWDWVGGRYSMSFRHRALDDGRHRPGQFSRHAKWAPPDGRTLPHRSLRAEPSGAHGPSGSLVQRFLWGANRGGPALRAVPETVSSLPPATDDGKQWQACNPRRGKTVAHETAPIYWGEPGTNGQHSFYQLIHQGTRLIPCDFIAFVQPLNPLGRHHDVLIANVCAQAEALAFGKTPEQVAAEGTPEWLVPHRVFEGNRPSNTILAND